MSTPRWEPSAEAWKQAWEESSSLTEIADRLGISPNTLYGYAKREGIDLSSKRGTGGTQRTPRKPVTPEEAVAHDREMQRLREEMAAVKAKYAAAVKEANLFEDIRDIARECLLAAPVYDHAPPRVGDGQTNEDAILGWADWHGFETIDRDVMLGYNTYDPVIMARRVQYTVDHTLSILFDCHKGTTFARLHVFDLGDGINGDHLPEQLATNAKPVFEAMRGVAILKAAALVDLAAHIPVSYLCVPGNHGRRSQKMNWKQPTETADWLIGEMIRDLCVANERIEVIVPRAWSAGVTIRGYNHVLNHGFTSAKGGFGGISWYSFQRADGQKTAIESAHGKRVHARWYGHIHQKAEIPMMDGEGEQHIVGSLKGGDEYALEGLNRFSPASQKLVGCHDDHPVTWRYPLDVSKADETPSRYEGLVS